MFHKQLLRILISLKGADWAIHYGDDIITEDKAEGQFQGCKSEKPSNSEKFCNIN